MNIRLVSEDGNLGETTLDAAKKMAKAANKSLVMVNAKEGIYKIIDTGKLKFEQKQKDKNQRAQKRTHKIKEIKLRPNIADHDLEIKTNHIKGFLLDGLKTKITMQFRGREQSFQALGLEKVKKIVLSLCELGLATVDKGPFLEGRNLIVLLTPTK
jgi:translation initiation factor IF-3